MRRSVLIFAYLAVCRPEPSPAEHQGFKVIVHPENPVTSVDGTFVRDAFLKRVTEWGHGVSVRPVDLATPPGLRDRFTRDVLRKSPAQLKSYWNQQIFSGKGVPPPKVTSTARAIAYVLANRGAIAYLPPNADPGPTKVVLVR